MTAITSPHDGLNQGDYVLKLDKDFASKMQEIMVRTADCDEGVKFDREHPTRRRQSTARLGRAICAYHAVLTNMGGALSDLTQTNLGDLNFAIPAFPAERAAAFEYTQELTAEYAPIINLQVDRMRLLGAYIFAVTIGVISENKPLGVENKIPSELVQTGTPSNRPTQTTASPSSSTSSGCPDPTNTPVSF